MENNIILIHVGKCSGTFLELNLQKININYQVVHHANEPYDTQSPQPNLLAEQYNTTKFICTFRHPIDRWVSTFNFKYDLAVTKNRKEQQWDGERKGLLKYYTANNLAEQLYDNNGNPNADVHNFAANGCDHFKFNLNHYLCNFDENHDIKVIRHEHVDDDFLKTFNVEITKINKKLRPNPKSKDKISMIAYNNLKRFLKEEYDLIDNFASFGFISEEYRQFCHGLPKSTTIKV